MADAKRIKTVLVEDSAYIICGREDLGNSLFEALYNNNMDEFRYVIESNSVEDLTGMNMEPVWKLSCTLRNYEALEALLAILEKRKEEEFFAKLLIIAIHEGTYMAVKGLIKIGVNVSKAANWKNNDRVHIHSLDEGAGVSPIFKSIVVDNHHITQLIINAKPNLEVTTISGLTPLKLAIRYDRFQDTRALIEAGANVNARDINGDSPICQAIFRNDMYVIILIENNADVNNINKKLDTPLHLACKGHTNKVSKVKLLLGARAKVDCRNRDGFTALHCAVNCNKLETVKLLIKAGANVDEIAKNGNTPLIMAIEVGNCTMMTYLIKEGANIEHKTKTGLTPLLISYARKDPSPTKTLLKHGANLMY